MKKFLLGCFTGVIFVALSVVLIGFSVVRMGQAPPPIASGSTLVLRVEGSLPEQAPTESPFPMLTGQPPLTIRDLWEILHKAEGDSRIKAIILEPRGVGAGWARVEEIRDQLASFRKTGKPLVAFLRGAGLKEYYLASAADRIYMTPEDTLDIKGLRIEAMYLKNTLDKLGVQMEVEHAGKYKDAGDVFTRTSMSPETREVLNQVLDQFYGNFADTVAAGRKKQPADIRDAVENGPYMGQKALARGLVDQLAFEDQLKEDVKRRANISSIKPVSGHAYLRNIAETGGKRIALIVGEGEITRGEGNDSGFGGNSGITAGGFTKLLRQVENDSSIQGAIIRVDSPGGDGVASDDILHEAKNLSHKKPVVISMGDLAASGGYFISMTGDPVIAYPNTITGSIGVIFGKLNLHGLYDKLGIQKELLTRGRYAALDSDYKPLSEDERQKLRVEIDDFYRGFVERVAEGRRRSYDQIEPLAQGRVWMGTQAKSNGLVDELGGLDRAVELVKRKAKIGVNEKVTLVPYPPRRNVLDRLFRNPDEAAVLETSVQKMVPGFPVRAWVRGGFLKVMPYTITIQ